MKHIWIERNHNYISIHSKRNHTEFVFGKGAKFGIFGGLEVFRAYDWWHLTIGFTAICLYITVKIRWRVFGCQYKRFDKEDIYI